MTRTRLRPAAVLIAVTALTGGTAGAAVAAPAASAVRLVVQTVSDRLPSRSALSVSAGGLDVRSVRALGDGLAEVTVDTHGTGADPAAAALERSALIDSATPDRRVHALGVRAPITTPDPFLAAQWDLWDSRSTARAGGYGTDAPRAWQRTTGADSVVIAVLDTGITEHPDLDGAAIAAGRDFVSEQTGVETGDGDGWDDDPSDPGDACAESGEAASWHGTFVAGEIVAQHGSSGVAGEAPGVTLEPVRVLGGCGGSEADTIAAIEWASGGTVPGVPQNERPANVVSLSLGSSSGGCSAAMGAAVQDAIARGVVVVAAAGNEDVAVAGTSPASCAGVVAVAASTRSGRLAGYSNHGTPALSPTIAGPGGSDAAPVLGDTWTSTTTFDASGNDAGLGWSEGTSMATPRVAAAAALLLSVEPGLSPAEVTARLVRTATPFATAARCTRVRCGPGIVNAGNLLGARRLFVRATSVRITGIARVGRRVTAHAGTWHPTPTAVRYRWLRDGAPIAGAVHRTYVLTAKDGGHRVSVRVTVRRAGTASAGATSPARRIG